MAEICAWRCLHQIQSTFACESRGIGGLTNFPTKSLAQGVLQRKSLIAFVFFYRSDSKSTSTRVSAFPDCYKSDHWQYARNNRNVLVSFLDRQRNLPPDHQFQMSPALSHLNEKAWQEKHRTHPTSRPGSHQRQLDQFACRDCMRTVIGDLNGLQVATGAQIA